jgi:polysaccharide export outer membrane protein
MVLASSIGPRCVFCAALLGILLAGAPLRAQQTGVQPVAPAQQSAPAQQQAPVLETPQQTNERIRDLSVEAKNVHHDYVIGDGDLLDISVFDVPELTRQIRVSQTGTVGIPLVPVRMHVSGLTELQAEQKIAEVLEANGLVSHPEVAVMVREHKSRPITVVGAVVHPMVYEADRQVTLLEVLAEAGGVAPDAGDTVIVTRLHTATFTEIEDSTAVPAPTSKPAGAPGSGEPPSLDEIQNATAAPKTAASGTTVFSAVPDTKTATAEPSKFDGPLTINLDQLLEAGDTHDNMVLQAGDVVTVPHAGIIYVLGAVQKPGGFVLSNDRSAMTTLKILSLAGGTTNIAKLDHAVIIRRDGTGKESQTEVDLKKIVQRQTEDVQMRASDILYIPDSKTKQALLKALELGVGVGSAVAIFRLAYH